MTDSFTPFSVRLDILIRACRAEDLPALEWWGLFQPHRELIRNIFERHARGDAAVMLVAEANGMASGQVWMDLVRQQGEGIGVIWALRVFPCLQRSGVGSHLVQAAEAVLRAQGCDMAETSVERSTPGPRSFFGRLGYREVEAEPWSPPGSPPPPSDSQWVLRKRLAPGP
jgi:ribosomal protein S18 acetylase RimI-like enzyme